MPRSTKTEAILSYTVTMKNKQEGPTVKANNLVCIVSRWYGRRMTTDYQQKLLLSGHDTGERLLLRDTHRERERESLNMAWVNLNMVQCICKA